MENFSNLNENKLKANKVKIPTPFSTNQKAYSINFSIIFMIIKIMIFIITTFMLLLPYFNATTILLYDMLHEH